MKNDAQAYGAACTYFRRFSLCAMVGICPEDDDGNLASQPPKQTQVSPNNDPKLSPDLCIALKKMLSALPTDFVNSFLATLRAPPISANCIEQIPASQFDRIFAYLQTKLNEVNKINE